MTIATTALLLAACQGGAWMPDWEFPNPQYVSSLAVLADRDLDARPELLLGSTRDRRVDLVSSRTGAPIYSILSSGLPDQFGCSVVRLGDLDHDSFEDFAVGAYLDSRNGPYAHGAIHVYSGRDGVQLSMALGVIGQEYLGAAMFSPGDLDGDGWSDILATSHVSLSNPLKVSMRAISSRTGATLYWIHPPPTDTSFNAGGVGLKDCDGDLVPDYAVSASGTAHLGTVNGGWVGIYSGASGVLLVQMPGWIPSQGFGTVLGFAGDLNDDGFDDLIASGGAGPGENPAGLAISGRNLSVLFPLDADPIRPEIWSAAGGGVDFDGDGVLDLFVSDRQADVPGELENGRITVFHGGTGARTFEIWGDLASSLGQQAILLEAAGRSRRPGILAISSDPLTHRIHGFAFEDLLYASTDVVSSSAGDRVELRLRFPEGEAGFRYLLLASATGAGPANFGGVLVPLSPDGLYRRMILGPPPIFTGARGRLDANGEANATLVLAPGASAHHVGRTIRFAAVSYEGVLARLASRAVALAILP